MAMVEFKQGSTICSKGDPLKQLLIVMKGKAETSFNGRPLFFEQGDALGLSDLITGTYSRPYTAVTDVTIFDHPYEDVYALGKLLDEKPDTAYFLITSMCRQITELLQYRYALKQEAMSIYDFATDGYNQYKRLCKLYALTPKQLSGLSELMHPTASDPIEDWIHDYYMQIKSLPSNLLKEFFRKSGIALGFLCRSAEDISQVSQACKIYHHYLVDNSKILLAEDGHDMLSIISDMHIASSNVSGADATVGPLVQRLSKTISQMTRIDPEYRKERFNAYKEKFEARQDNQEKAAAPGAGSLKQNLANSLNEILKYSELPEEDCNKFMRDVIEYRSLSDRGGSDDVAYKLRRRLTEDFYNIYQPVFIKSLHDPNVPTVIKMFLNFGYVDAALAGYDNADYLYSIADSLKGDPKLGVYTVVDWLTAIYKGEKEPSRNDFDEDYTAFIHEMRVARRIDEEEEKRLLADLEGRLRFELENVFPTVNKITFGRMTTFCPIFADHNVQRDLDVAILRPEKIREVLDEIRRVDFSAFSRETIYSNPEGGVQKEYIHKEVLPNFILMPNLGVRGTMWQEIEGRRRDTPARIFVPLFFLGDLKKLLIQLTAEYRWEMCKRIQGVRWTDLSDPSLTSEFFDYLQFYRSNRELSTDVKSAIKTELIRAKNTYKSVFVSNYSEWIVYEANGSPRLNKFVRRILSVYCPFAMEIRENMKMNPLFTELLRRYELKQSQKAYHLNNVITKLEKDKREVPQELRDEIEYLKK